VREENTAAQRFYRRLGARLWPKVVVWWPPEAQRALLGDRPAGRIPADDGRPAAGGPGPR
jgi:hypothetical protein